MITEDYVSFEIAKLLKEKGFNELCNRVYQGPNLKYTDFPISPLMSLGELGGFHPKQLYVTNDELGDIVHTAPTQQMAIKWLRKVHHLHIGINPVSGKGYNATIYDVADFDDYGIISDTKFFFHVEEACEAAIKYCLENLI